MHVEMHMCFELNDIPPSVMTAIQDAYPASKFGAVSYIVVTAKQLSERLPNITGWLSRMGLYKDDVRLLIKSSQ